MSNELEIVEQYRKEVATAEQDARAVSVYDDVTAVQTSSVIAGLKAKLKKAKAFFKPIVESAHLAHKNAKAGENEICQPIDRAATILSDKVAAYQYQQQLKRDRQEQKERDIAAAKEKEKQDKLLEKAATADTEGNTEKAEELVEKAEEVYVAPKPVAVPVQTQTSVRVVYDIEVLNKSKVPLQYMLVDESKIGRCKRADKAFEVPGVKFHPRAIGSTRAK